MRTITMWKPAIDVLQSGLGFERLGTFRAGPPGDNRLGAGLTL